MTTRWGLLARRRLRPAALLLMAVSGAAIAQHTAIHAGAHQHIDGRFSHNRYYFDHGYSVHRPPGEHRRISRRLTVGGTGFTAATGTVGAAAIGWSWAHPSGYSCLLCRLILRRSGGMAFPTTTPTTPIMCGTMRSSSIRSWHRPRAWILRGTTQAPASDQLFVYPNKGQSAEQQENDRYECHRLAVQQSGFDPTKAGGGVEPQVAVAKRNDYFNTLAACLQSRGYSVR